MSWRKKRALRSQLGAGRRVLVQELRAGRPGGRWARPFGIACLALAAWAALDPDYSLPRSVPTASSAGTPVELGPRPLAPIGALPSSRPRFEWRCAAGAPEFDFVLLDDGLEEVERVRVRGCALDATDSMAQRLADGAQYHWLVEAIGRGERRRSVPVAVGFSR